jgi:DNA-binding transcriptional MerR regulator
VRISELSRETGVPVATIKFYLREGLVPEGRRTSATQSQYDEQHAARLRLIRALVGPGGLSLALVRGVLEAIDDPPESMHQLLGVAAAAVERPTASLVDHTRVHGLMERWGWRIDDKDCSTHAALEEALQALDNAGFELPEGALDAYQQQMAAVAAVDIAGVPTESAAAAVRYVILGTVLVEPVLIMLRRMAHQEASGRRFG